MQLHRAAVEYYRLAITTTPAVTGAWEASFDNGTTWTDATALDDDVAWLLAGPDSDPADRGDAILLTASVVPLVRVKDTPEVIVRRPPGVYLYA